MIFVSYRRDDTRGVVNHLRRVLVERYGPDAIFVDDWSIDPGRTWPDEIRQRLVGSRLVLVVVGDRWMTPRLSDPEDWVRQEICMAYDRGIRLIVVPIDKATLPETKWGCHLDRLRDNQQAQIENGRRFDGDVVHLIQSMEKLVPELRRLAETSRGASQPTLDRADLRATVIGADTPGLPGAPDLVVEHLGGDDDPRFRVTFGEKRLPPVSVIPPPRYVARGKPQNLLVDLRRHLRSFDRAHPEWVPEPTLLGADLKRWGRHAYDKLFGGHQRKAVLAGARRRAGAPDTRGVLTVQIVSDDPSVLAWPWEVLQGPSGDPLAISGDVKRQPASEHRSSPSPSPPASEHRSSPSPPASGPGPLRVLLVAPAPRGCRMHVDSIFAPLLSAVLDQQLAVRFTILHPPTIAHLRTHVEGAPDRYHVIHILFLDSFEAASDQGRFGRGRLVFEGENGEPDMVDGTRLGFLAGFTSRILLSVVPSALETMHTPEALASIALDLLGSGICSVVALTDPLSPPAWRCFLLAFYARLLECGGLSQAVRHARNALRGAPERSVAGGGRPLHDWIVPVLYENTVENTVISASFDTHGVFAAPVRVPMPVTWSTPTAPAGTSSPGYDMLGRDCELLALERALSRPACRAALITGPDGIGKTTLARALADWSVAFRGVPSARIHWIDGSCERLELSVVLRALSAPLGTASPERAGLDQSLDEVLGVCLEREHLIVWDDAGGVASPTDTEPTSDQQDELNSFFRALGRGPSRLVLVSASPNRWIDDACLHRQELGGLAPLHRWAYCEAVVGSVRELTPGQRKALETLVEHSAGHPLIMRMVLADRSALALPEVLRRLSTTADPVMRCARIASALMEQGSAPVLASLTRDGPIVDGRASKGTWKLSEVQKRLSHLEKLGLARRLDNSGNRFRLHPILCRRSAIESSEGADA